MKYNGKGQNDFLGAKTTRKETKGEAFPKDYDSSNHSTTSGKVQKSEGLSKKGKA